MVNLTKWRQAEGLCFLFYVEYKFHVEYFEKFPSDTPI